MASIKKLAEKEGNRGGFCRIFYILSYFILLVPYDIGYKYEPFLTVDLLFYFILNFISIFFFSQGYMKNVISGEHYKFVTMWMGRTSYTVSFLLMFVFVSWFLCLLTLVI